MGHIPGRRSNPKKFDKQKEELVKILEDITQQAPYLCGLFGARMAQDIVGTMWVMKHETSVFDPLKMLKTMEDIISGSRLPRDSVQGEFFAAATELLSTLNHLIPGASMNKATGQGPLTIRHAQYLTPWLDRLAAAMKAYSERPPERSCCCDDPPPRGGKERCPRHAPLAAAMLERDAAISENNELKKHLDVCITEALTQKCSCPPGCIHERIRARVGVAIAGLTSDEMDTLVRTTADAILDIASKEKS